MSKNTITTKLPTALAPFTGVNNATARLLKAISATELGTLQEGDLVYVQSLRDYYKWLPASVIVDDPTSFTYVAPTIVGASAGRFERMMFQSPDWMLQATWVIDAAVSLGTSNNENDGATAVTALLTDLERQRRMGVVGFGQANLTAYHFRYISNVPATQQVLIRLDPNSGAQIFIHGSMTDGAGQSTIFTGTSGTITTENYAAAGGGQPWEMVCSTIPVSWTASGCVDKRLRWTSGANSQRILWITKDLGVAAPNARARLSEPQVFSAFTFPYALSINTYTPVAGDTFVIENLTIIPNLQLEIFGGGTNTSIVGPVLDSVDIGNGGQYVPNVSGRFIVEWGCALNRTSAFVIPASRALCGCQLGPNSNSTALQFSINNSYNANIAGAITLNCIDVGSLTRHMTQGNAVLRLSSASLGDLQTVAGQATKGWTINQLGIFDVNVGNWPLHIVNQARLTPTSTLWGSGNITNFAPIIFYRGAKLTYGANSAALPASYFYLQPASAGADAGAFIEVSAALGVVTAFVPAFDPATNLFTANILLSPTNLQTTVAAGGFGGHFFDPINLCSMGEA